MSRVTNRLSIVVGVSFALCAFCLSPRAHAATPEQADKLKKAEELSDQGAFSRARDLLIELAKLDLGSGANRQVARDLKRAETELIEVYSSAQDAGAQYDAATAQRQRAAQSLATKLDVLKKEAAALEARGDVDGAREKYMSIAQMRAADAFAAAESCLERGEIQSGVALLEQIKASGVDIGKEKMGRLAQHIQSAPVAAENIAAGRKICEARLAAEQAAIASRKADEACEQVGQVFKSAGKARTFERQLQLYGDVVRMADEIEKGPGVPGAANSEKLSDMRRESVAKLNAIKVKQDKAIESLSNGLALRDSKDYETARSRILDAINSGALPAARENEAQAALADVVRKQDEADEQRRNESAALLKKTEAEPDTQARARAMMDDVLKQQALLAQREEAMAKDAYERGVDLYRSGKLDEALGLFETALNHKPDYPEAARLRDEIRFLTGKGVEPGVMARELAISEQVRVEQMRMQVTENMQSGYQAEQEGDYDVALSQYGKARDILAYLRTTYDVSGTDAMIANAVTRVEAQKAQTLDRLEEKRKLDAEANLRSEVRRQIELQEANIGTLFEKAWQMYAAGQYEEAAQQAQNVLQLDPGNVVAKDLKDRAEDAYLKRTWRLLAESQEKARLQDLQNIKRQLVWPPKLMIYPTKEEWEEIKRRGSVPLPSREAEKAPREMQLEEALETNVSLEYELPTDLKEIVDFLNELVKNQIGVSNPLRLDPRIITPEVPRQVQITQQDIKLRKALALLVTDASTDQEILDNNELDYFIFRDAGVIYISNKNTILRLRMRQKEFRFYDIRDLLAVLGARGLATTDTGTTGGTTTSGTTTGTTIGSTGTTTTGSTTTGGTSTAYNVGVSTAGMDSLARLLQELTGPQNWGTVQIISAGQTTTTGTATTGTTSLGITTPTEGEGGEGLGSLLTGGGGAGGVTAQYLGRMFMYGTGDLLVEQTPEIHARIEEVLTRLRAMTESQIYVEVRFITYTDNFLESFGVNEISSIQGDVKRVKGIPAWNYVLNITGSEFNEGALTPGGKLSINFLNAEQTKLVIQAVKESQYAAIMQAPAMTVINTEARVLAFSKIFHYTSGFDVGTNGILTPIIAEIAQGTTLWVRPVISGDRRYVTLEVLPSFDVVTFEDMVWEDFITITVPTTPPTTETHLIKKLYKLPILERKSYEARVRVPDRGTVIFAGFTTATTSSKEGGVPILINIPFFKRLFGAKTEVERRSHEVFLVTTTILLPEEIEAKLPVY